MDYEKECEQLKRRLSHLLESEFIAEFDEWDPRKNNYKRDISIADKVGFSKRNNNAVVINIQANGIDDVLEKTREIAINLERAAKAKEKL